MSVADQHGAVIEVAPPVKCLDEVLLATPVQHVFSVLQDSVESVGSGDTFATTIPQSVRLLNGLKERAASLNANANGESASDVDDTACPCAEGDSSQNDCNSSLHTLAESAVFATNSLSKMIGDMNRSRGKKSSGHVWKALKSLVASTFEEADEAKNTLTTENYDAFALELAVLAAGVALSVDSSDPTTAKMIASAVIPGDYARQMELINGSDTISREVPKGKALQLQTARTMVLKLLILAAMDGASASVDLQIVAKIESGFGVGKYLRSNNVADAELEGAVADAVDRVFGRERAGDAVGNGTGDEEKTSAKEGMAPAIALVASVQPWGRVDVGNLLRASAERDLWYSAELLCDAAVDSVAMSQPSTEGSENVAMATSFPKEGNTEALLKGEWDASSERDTIAHVAAGTIVDVALDERMYRRADLFSTKYYLYSGPERYAKARFMHACETITKLVTKRQIQIIDKQIDRVDGMVSRVCKDLMLTPASANGSGEMLKYQEEDDVPIERMSVHIRELALRRLRGANNHSAATRLAKIWGWRCIDDPLVLEEEAKRRKLTYLQWDDEICPGASRPLPEPIYEAANLIAQFEELEGSGGGGEKIIGFDCEFHDAVAGVALLQLSTLRRSLLLDVPALTKTKEGCDALRNTIGRLFSRSTSITHVIGFGCKDDIKRLRASPTVGDHWFPQTDKSLYMKDLRVLILESSSKFRAHHFGLSRACEAFLGKQLDKAEQCSDWSNRPLTPEQREYAALDAWACAAIMAKIFEGESPVQS